MKSPTVFLESSLLRQHKFYGFRSFNVELIKALVAENDCFQLRINLRDKSFMELFRSERSQYSRYSLWQRSKLFWLFEKKINLWHSLNQAIAIEPHRVDRYVVTIHDLINYKSNNKKYSRRIEYKVKLADAIVYISEHTKQMAHQLLPIRPGVREYVIYNGSPTQDVLDFASIETLVPSSFHPYIFSIGKFEPRKNFHSLVEMLTANKEFNLVLAGQNSTPYGEQVREMAQKCGVAHRVFLLGNISEVSKQSFIRQAVAVAVPSLEEGFGLPVIEAFQFGKPVFLSNASSLPEIGGSLAYYFKEFEPCCMHNTLIEGLHHFMCNKTEMEQQLIQRAGHFSWQKAAHKYLQVYKELLFE